jgi:hypothetical protein
MITACTTSLAIGIGLGLRLGFALWRQKYVKIM